MRHGSTRPRPSTATTFPLLALALCAPGLAEAGEWVLPDSGLGVRTAPILLLSRADVQADLGLSTEQILSAQRAIRDLRSRASALKGLPDAEAIAARRAIDEAQQRWLEQQLNDDQRARLLQVDLQWEGPAAVITRPWLAEHLGLSDDQRRALSQAVARRDSMRVAPTADTPTDAPDERPLAREVLATLNAEQQQAWKALLGQPFTVRLAAPVDGRGVRR